MKLVRRLWPYVALLLLLALGATLIVQRDVIMDAVASRGYTPSGHITQLVADTTMTPYAKRLFYANRPAVEDKAAFNEHCSGLSSDQIATLGCFTGNRQGIYIYKITEPLLNGVEQVTAAHEMLHQAYDRLKSSERTRIDSILQQYYASMTDTTIKDQIDSYKKTEPPEQFANEMHSIFGTEIINLPDELDQYYQQYFTNRSKVVDYYQQYQSEFDKRRKQIQAYDSQLSDLKKHIDDNRTELTNREKALQNKRTELDKYLSNDQIIAYNAAVPAFNSQVGTYRTLVNQTNDLINTYNKLLEEQNAIAIQQRGLQQALDSRVNSASKQ